MQNDLNHKMKVINETDRIREQGWVEDVELDTSINRHLKCYQNIQISPRKIRETSIYQVKKVLKQCNKI